MSQTATAPSRAAPLLPQSHPALLGWLVRLALPVLAENILHMGVGWSDTYLAGHLPSSTADATASIGLITYVIWLVGLLAGAIGAGSTAIIARATGARHRRLANSVAGQSVTAAVVVGLVSTAIFAIFATQVAESMGVQAGNAAMGYCVYYLRVLGLSLPFMMLMLAANACLRGAGDSVSPAIAMIVVDVVNIVSSFALTRGWFGLPTLGFRGIAIGTVIAYIAGGLIQLAVLIRGRRSVRLFWHRLPPHWHTMKRILRVGLPNGAQGLLTWLAQIVILRIIFELDPLNILSAAHIITIRIESLSFMTGLAVATAAATVVGISLGQKRPDRAQRGAHLAFAVGGGLMTVGGIGFIFFRHPLAAVLSDDPRVVDLAARCLFITALAQPGFAAALCYGGALQGAGDTFAVMLINIASIFVLRLAGVLLVSRVWHLGLEAVWMVLAIELSLRGGFMLLRFLHGGWKLAKV